MSSSPDRAFNDVRFLTVAEVAATTAEVAVAAIGMTDAVEATPDVAAADSAAAALPKHSATSLAISSVRAVVLVAAVVDDTLEQSQVLLLEQLKQ